MSQHTLTPSDEGKTLGLESGLEALRNSPTFRGPVEPLGDHDSHDHLALVYETTEEQFSAAIPFVEQGLDRNERCLYIADENSKTEVLAAMRDAGVDADAARESGALTLHTKQDTYCRNGGFDPDDMIAFLAAEIEAATEEYEALRVTGEMTWIFGDDPEIADLVEYEGKLNRLLPDENGIALCQYNRNRFPAEVLRDVVRTHPHLVYDNTVCHNAYYTPPEEFFGPDRPAREVDRMLDSLRDRTTATVSLRERERELQRQNDRLESFASMLAHELRNPLTIAQIYLQSAVEGDETATEKVDTALDRIEEMIDVLLVTARGSDSNAECESVALATAAAEAWAEVAPESADLVVEADRTIRTDPVHIWHLLENLLRNAVEHGGDDVTVRVGDLEDVSSSSEGRSPSDRSSGQSPREDEASGGSEDEQSESSGGFYVADDGPGIPAADRDAVFEAGHTTDDAGIGLGLTFVAQLAETYEWDCTVTESESGGARFEFSGVEGGSRAPSAK
ncbi:MEDS domain-containing protein [Halorussus sp. MSC15.2]|uniref:MEDS domain-containing protein n=1 Tax=Halorussus sp. MSC15.2 TaxID=2283638 RepID=UPI0013D101FD|nr:MEDS domain-containing protein [Halorussus sp. MSC15.2]NEU56636.1 histidine kinase [Halorussus sp. MSC15.2]